MEAIITITVIAFLGFVIFKALNALFKVLPESGFRSFMLSDYGEVFTGFMSLALLCVIYIYMMVYVLNINC
jgi:hypothetical protein